MLANRGELVSRSKRRKRARTSTIRAIPSTTRPAANTLRPPVEARAAVTVSSPG